MKKIIALLPILLLASGAFAQTTLSSPPTNIDVVAILGRVGDLLIGFAVPIATIMVIVSGFYFMTAQGDPGKIDKAKSVLLWALIGMAVVLLAKAAISLVQGLASSS